MLSALDIRNVVLIEALALDFGAGLGALTGETGAGKSILLDSLGLALGARGETGLVRAGQSEAQVSAIFHPAKDHPGWQLLDEQGIDTDDGEIILRRIVKSDGGSRAFVNNQPVSAGFLRDLGALLVEIHGQHDERGLLNPRGHRAMLDGFGGYDTDMCAAAYREWQAAQAAFDKAKATLEEGLRDRAFLDHAVAELRALAPEPGEEATLAARRSDMMKGQRIAEDMAAIAEDLTGAEGGLARLRTAARRLERVAEQHPLLAEALAAVDRAINEAGEAEDQLAAAAEALAFDPAELDLAEERLFALRAIARKHRVEPDRLAELAAEMEARALAIDAGEEGLLKLEKALGVTRAQFEVEADRLSAARAEAAARLDVAIKAELKPLKLDAAQFRTSVSRLPDTQWGAAGADHVEFEISTNPGAPFGPLAKIASGGELSRFILALKVALAETRQASTIIFDEIDRGVGGAVASAIGERLSRLSKGGQLLVVTHSPQVAARADHQYRIAKSSDGTVARTGVERLGDMARREEIARMLSGAEVTDEARAQAERLMA